MNNSFWSAFFGITDPKLNNLARNQMPNRQYSVDFFGKKQAVWVDTSDSYKLYIEIPELRTVINKKAQMLSLGIPKLVNDKGDIIEKHWVLDLIKNPNPLQSWSDVIYSISVNDSLHSSSFVYAPKRIGEIVNLFVPLPSHKMQINTTGKSLKQMTKDGLIKSYTYNYDGQNKEDLSLEEIIIIQANDGINILNPVSRIESLKFPISNIKAQYNKRNVLLENLGAIGILSSENSDMGGALPMTPEEKRDIQRDWYYRNKDELMITESAVKWQPMSYPTKDLMLFEELTADKLAIIDLFGLNYYIFSNEKGSTYSNVRDGMRMAYTDTIIPESKKIYDNITESLGLDKQGLRLIADYDHVPVLQDDYLSQSEALNKRADALTKIVNAGIGLSEEEMRALLNI
jgi:phage portal protein BeeE